MVKKRAVLLITILIICLFHFLIVGMFDEKWFSYIGRNCLRIREMSKFVSELLSMLIIICVSSSLLTVFGLIYINDGVCNVHLTDVSMSCVVNIQKARFLLVLTKYTKQTGGRMKISKRDPVHVPDWLPCT